MSLSRGNVRIPRLAPIVVVAAAGALVLAAGGVARAATPAAVRAAGARAAALPAAGIRAAAAASPFTCAADPLRITAAGRPGPNLAKPCRNDTVGGAQSTGTVGAIQVSATGVSGTTGVGGGATALEAGSTGTTVTGQSATTAKSAKLVAGKTVIMLGAMATKSMISCTYGTRSSTYSFHSTSSVGSLMVNGKAVAVGTGAKSIKVPGGTLMLNHAVATATGVVQHAAMLHTSSGDVVLGESAVGLSTAAGNPCHR